MKQTDPQFKLRLPLELKNRLDEVAAMNRRSTTAEIVARLEQSFEVTPDYQERRIKGIAEVLEQDKVYPAESAEEGIIAAIREQFQRMREAREELERREEEARKFAESFLSPDKRA